MVRKKKGLVDEARELAEDVADAVRPHVESARDTAAEFVHDKAEPMIAAGAADVAERADAARTAASDAADSVADATGHPRKKKRSKLKVVLVLGALAGVAAFVAKKLKGDQPDWQASTTPPAPVPSADPTASSSSSTTAAEKDDEEEEDEDGGPESGTHRAGGDV